MRGGRRLRILGNVLAGAMAEAVTASAARAADCAREMVPVDSGALRASISTGTKGALRTAVFAAAPHAAMVEYGTSRMPPRPYMLPAAQEVREGFFADARAAVRRCLKEI